MNGQSTLPSSTPLTRHALSLAFGLTLLAAASGCNRTPAALPADDATLTHAIQNKIATDSSISSEPIQASVQSAIATLTGTVSNDAARSLAANDVAQVPGIKTVVNDLTVQAAPVAAMVAAPPPLPPVKTERADRHKPSAVVPRDLPPVSQPTPPPPPAPAPIERAEQPAPAPVAPPPPPPVPTVRSITLAPDTVLPIRINQTLDSASTQTGDTFNGVIASDVLIDDLVVLPQGTPVTGRVSAVQDAAHFKGNSLLTIELTTIERHGERIAVATDTFSKAGEGRGKNTAEKIGGGAAVGAILGGILGGGKGAAIGAAAGGGGGAAVNAATRGQQVQIPAETLVRFHLVNALSVRVPAHAAEHHDDGDLPHHYN